MFVQRGGGCTERDYILRMNSAFWILSTTLYCFLVGFLTIDEINKAS